MPPGPTAHRDQLLLTALAACASIAAFSFYYRHHLILLYGDAVAHINIARRVFDSRTPGPLQLGTVWLPLPHVLMLPFLLSDRAWGDGWGGSLVSMAAYVAGTLGIFRLVRRGLHSGSPPDPAARRAAWAAAILYAANPNLLYLQATAMTESLYLALFVWTVVFLAEYAQQLLADGAAPTQAAGSLRRCGLCLAGAMLTRYDGWALGAAVAWVAIVLALPAYSAEENRPHQRVQLRRATVQFLLLAAAVPVFWLAYNGIIYRNPLNFANGPYSPHAIQQRATPAGEPHYPGYRNPWVAALYFLKSCKLNLGEGVWASLTIGIASLGTVLLLLWTRRLAVWLLLWLPLAFYTLSISYGDVPLYVPPWWPYSYYNVRYGLQLLPAVAAFSALLVFRVEKKLPRARVAAWAGLLVLVAAGCVSVWRARPVSLREAWVNSRTRIALESRLAELLQQLPPTATLLMYTADHPGALQQAGIPLRRVIREGDHRCWLRPVPCFGMWEEALQAPQQWADYAVAFAGDPVWQSAQQHGLPAMALIEVPGQPRAAIYRLRPAAQGPGPRQR